MSRDTRARVRSGPNGSEREQVVVEKKELNAPKHPKTSRRVRQEHERPGTSRGNRPRRRSREEPGRETGEHVPPEERPNERELIARIEELEKRTRLAEERFIEEIRRSLITSPERTAQAQRAALNELHRAHMTRMVHLCLSPLQNGVSPKNVIAAAGLGTAMWMLSPDFRSHLGRQAVPMEHAVHSVREGRPSNESGPFVPREERPQGGEAAHEGPTDRPRETERGDLGGLGGLSERSAALMHVGIVLNAHDQMLKPGVDRELVGRSHEQALRGLYRQAEADGLDRERMRNDIRALAGPLIESDPALARAFAGPEEPVTVEAEVSDGSPEPPNGHDGRDHAVVRQGSDTPSSSPSGPVERGEAGPETLRAMARGESGGEPGRLSARNRLRLWNSSRGLTSPAREEARVNGSQGRFALGPAPSEGPELGD